jgi:1,2-diacylglycerol 3-beta-glucosyltransferase
LLASVLLAWLTISVTLAARVLQALTGLSLIYVGYLAWRGWAAMRTAMRSGDDGPHAGARERISVIVPARNEAAVIGRIVDDLAAQAYADEAGEPCYEVVVVDDGSTDGTGDAARAAGAGARHIRVIRREPGSGPATKGGALAFATRHVTGEVVCVLDADARVPSDFLSATLRGWSADRDAAALQVRRLPWNARRGWLTAAQAEEQLMDLASQCGRWAADGTAELRGNGMFVRRTALDAVGGWAPSALTEDLDLSTRLAVVGERVTIAPQVVVTEEAVESLRALWGQRMRWAEGSLRRLMEHGPRLLAGPVPLGRKADFLAFVGEFVVPPLFAASIVASLVTIPLPQPADWTVPVSLALVYGVGTFLLAMAGLAADGVRGPTLVGRAARGALFMSHWLVVVPAAMARIAFWPVATRFVTPPRATPPPDR